MANFLLLYWILEVELVLSAWRLVPAEPPFLFLVYIKVLFLIHVYFNTYKISTCGCFVFIVYVCVRLGSPGSGIGNSCDLSSVCWSSERSQNC